MRGDDQIRVIVVEDDSDLCESLCAFLRFSDMDARAATSVAELEKELEQADADVIVLDVNLPGETGFAAIDRLGLKRRAGIILLTGRSALHDRLQGLTLGADHYLVKPVDMTLLTLMIRNLHARLEGSTPRHGWEFDAQRWTLTSPDGRLLPLGTQECRLLERLMAQPGRPVPRADLIAALQPRMAEAADREVHLEVLVFRLRRKVQKVCECPLPLQSVRGFGYVFAPDTQADFVPPEAEDAAPEQTEEAV